MHLSLPTSPPNLSLFRGGGCLHPCLCPPQIDPHFRAGGCLHPCSHPPPSQTPPQGQGRPINPPPRASNTHIPPGFSSPPQINVEHLTEKMKTTVKRGLVLR